MIMILNSKSTKSAVKRYLSIANEIYLNAAGLLEAAAVILNIVTKSLNRIIILPDKIKLHT